MTRLRPFLAIVFAVIAAVCVSGIHGSLHYALASVFMFGALCALTYPVVRFLTGPGVASVIFAVPGGLLLNSLGLSLFAWVGGFQIGTLLVYAACAGTLSFLLWKRIRNDASSPAVSWETSDSNHLLLWLIVVTAAVAPAFVNVGVETPHGYAFRAYFNTDVFRNMATAGSLLRSSIPPENPYFAGYSLHYYWLFHVIPAFWMKVLPGFRVEFIFVQFAFLTALAFAAALWAVARSMVSASRTTVYLLPLFLFGGSYEGLYVLQNLSEKNAPWMSFTTRNVDGILRWVEKLPQVDTLYRPLLYAPQHLSAVIVFLLALLIWTRLNRVSQRLTLLGLIFISVGYSVIVGAIVVLSAGVLLLMDAARRRPGVWIEIAAGALLGVGFLALYLKGFQMFSLGHGDLKPLLPWPLLQKLPRFLFYQWGAILFFGTAGLLFWKQKDSRYVNLFVFFLISMLFVIFIQIDVPGLSDVSLKAGYISHATLLLFSAKFLDQVRAQSVARRRMLVAAMLILILPASVTFALDSYNCQDVRNLRFTTYIAKPQMELYRWMRNNLPVDARVQDYFDARSSFIESYVSETPPFANRSLFVGDAILARIFQTPKDELQRRRALAEHFSESSDPRLIASLAHRAGIQYIVAFPREEDVLDGPAGVQFLEKIAEQDRWKLYRVLLKDQPMHSASGDFLFYEEDSPALKTVYGKGFHPVEYLSDGEPVRWMSQDAILQFEAARDFEGSLQLVVNSFEKPRNAEFWWNGVLVNSVPIPRAATKVSIPLKIPAGKSELRIQSVEPPKKGPSGDHRFLSLKIWAVQWIPGT